MTLHELQIRRRFVYQNIRGYEKLLVRHEGEDSAYCDGLRERLAAWNDALAALNKQIEGVHNGQ